MVASFPLFPFFFVFSVGAALAGGYIYALGGLSSGQILGGADANGDVIGVERLSVADPSAGWEVVRAYGGQDTSKRAFSCAAALL